MRINEFFSMTLGAPLYNKVWSWGAVNKTANCIFLRSDRVSLDTFGDVHEWIELLHPAWKSSSGYRERQRHLDAIRAGTPAYVVVADMNAAGKIQSFDHDLLLKLGEIVEENSAFYGKVIGTVSVADVLPTIQAEGELVNEVLEAGGRDVPETTRQRLVEARLGQGRFRSDVLKLWNSRCAVTGVTVVAAIRASHLKPWSVSTNEERLDPKNGLPLVATLDALFDVGHISFGRKGELLISSAINAPNRELLQLNGLALLQRLPKETQNYLDYHRKNRFQG